MIYDIVQVVPFEDYTVYVYFEDGKIVCYDAKPLLDKKVFEPLRDKDFFLNSCTILNGTLAWDVWILIRIRYMNWKMLKRK